MFKLLSQVVNGVKGGVVSTLEGTADVAGSIVGAVRDVTVVTVKESGEFIKQGFDVPASIVKGSLEGVSEIGSSVIGAVKGVVRGTVHGFMQEGGKQDEAVQGAVGQAIKSAPRN